MVQASEITSESSLNKSIVLIMTLFLSCVFESLQVDYAYAL